MCRVAVIDAEPFVTAATGRDNHGAGVIRLPMLTERQRHFADAYLAHAGNGTAAAIAAG